MLGIGIGLEVMTFALLYRIRVIVGLMFMISWASVYILACRVSCVYLHVGFKLVYMAAWFG